MGFLGPGYSGDGLGDGLAFFELDGVVGYEDGGASVCASVRVGLSIRGEEEDVELGGEAPVPSGAGSGELELLQEDRGDRRSPVLVANRAKHLVELPFPSNAVEIFGDEAWSRMRVDAFCVDVANPRVPVPATASSAAPLGGAAVGDARWVGSWLLVGVEAGAD